MKRLIECALVSALAIVALGCTAEVQTTDDSVRFDAEVPKLERGDEPLDADPRTDDDLDVDTPATGER